MFLNECIKIKGSNMVLNSNYENEILCFYPHSEAVLSERKVKLINNTEQCINIDYNQAWYAYETGPIPDFCGLKSELLGE